MQSADFGRSARLLATIVGSFIAATSFPAFADQIVHYTDSCVEEQSGDVGGYVVLVSDSKPLPVISLSWSEGALKGPVVAKIIDFDRISGRVAFSVSIEWDEGKRRDIQFKGQFGRDRLEGTFTVPWDDAPQHVDLKVRSRKAAFEPETECR